MAKQQITEYQLWDLVDDRLWAKNVYKEHIITELEIYEEDYCRDVDEDSKHLNKDGQLIEGHLQELLDDSQFEIREKTFTLDN